MALAWSSCGGAAIRYVLPVLTHNGPCGGMWVTLQRVTSMRRRVRVDDPAASCWLLRDGVLDDRGCRD